MPRQSYPRSAGAPADIPSRCLRLSLEGSRMAPEGVAGGSWKDWKEVVGEVRGLGRGLRDGQFDVVVHSGVRGDPEPARENGRGTGQAAGSGTAPGQAGPPSGRQRGSQICCK